MDDNVQKKEMLSYLFINIKWNQEPGTEDLEHREPFQIGVIAADRNMQKIKIFSRGIRLSNIKSAMVKKNRMEQLFAKIHSY